MNALQKQWWPAYDYVNEESIRMNTRLKDLPNWTLYYGLLSRHPKELITVMYAPTEASDKNSYARGYL